MPPKVKSVYEVCPGFDVEMEDMLADIVSFRRHKPVKILPIQKGIIAVVIKDFYQYGFDYSVWIMTKENYSKVKGYCKLSYLPAMGIVQLDRNNRRVADEPALDIVNSYMFPFYRGQGIMRNAYLAIIHYFGSVRSRDRPNKCHGSSGLGAIW